MFTTDYSFYALKKKHGNLFGVTLAVAIVCLVFYVILMIGAAKGKLAHNMKGLDVYFLIGLIAFTVISLVIYFGKRFKITIKGMNDVLTVEIKDPALPTPLIIQSPFTLKRQWIHQLTGRKIQAKLLYLTIINSKEEPIVTFKGALGAAYKAPSKFEYIDILNLTQRSQLVIAPLVYHSKTAEVADEMTIYLNYINNKAESKKV